MSSDDFVIRAQGLGKTYQVYESPRARLQQFIVPRLNRWLGRPAPDLYREFHALRDVGFTVRRGETVGVVGRNGSGKSTLLQLVCGTLHPSAGSVEVRGRVAALLELGSGFNPEFTGRENVMLYAALLGLGRRQIEERFADIERFAAIGDFIDQPIKTYSSGMVVRLAFSVAIHVDPDILVVDEALAVGDTAFQQKCLHRIRAMQEAGVSILLVTHSSNALIEYCDRGIYLRNGSVVMDGPCREVVRRYGDDLLEQEGAISVSHVSAPVAGTDGPDPADSPAPAPEPSEGQQAGSGMQIAAVRLLSEAGAPAGTFRFDERVVVELELQVRQPVGSPCFGIQVSSIDGIVLWSATTQQIGRRLPPLDPGLYRFRWRIRANMSGNRYVVALGAGELLDGEYRRRHRIEYAGHFDVMPEQGGGSGWLAPGPEFLIQDE